MKPIKLIGLFSAMAVILIFLTGCPYESKFTLIGKQIKHPENIVGNWISDSVKLNISTSDNHLLHVNYRDYENGDQDSITGSATVIEHGKNKYIILKVDKTGTYFVAKIEKATKAHLLINIMDDKILKKKDAFTSDKAFSDFVFNNQKQVFLPDNKVLFKKIAQ